MKILAFTAGAAQMYCGSCLRDNALAAELKRQGHDIVLQPLYTPTKTDEENVSESRVFMNGITVCLEQQSSIFRSTRWLLDRVWDSQWMLRIASKSSIAVDPKVLGDMTVSMLRGESGFQRKDIGKLTDWLSHESKPDIVTLPNSLLLGLAKPIRQSVGRPICCTLQGESLYLTQLPEPYRTQSWELMRAKANDVDAFAAVSEFDAAYWREHLGIPASKIHVIPLGVHVPVGQASRPVPRRFNVSYLARIAPEKGLHLLAEAYIRAKPEIPEATLQFAGYLAPEHRQYLRSIESKLKTAAVPFHNHGELTLPQKSEFLIAADVFSVPCTYDEPKGISVLEAMSHGIPVIQPRRGSFTEVLARTGGGLLIEPDNPDALAAAIVTLYKDRTLAANLGRRAADGVREHYSTGRMAERALEAYRTIAGAAVHA